MILEINIDEYISDTEKRQIALEAFKDVCEDKFRKDSERIFSNTAHSIVWEEVAKLHDEDVSKKIAQKVSELIENLSEYSVFRATGHWEKESVAHKVMGEAVSENKENLKNRISKIIDGIDEDAIRSEVTDMATAIIEDRLFGGKK